MWPLNSFAARRLPGITVHYEGGLRSAADLRDILDVAQAAATESGWPFVKVIDEGEYWETRDPHRLADLLSDCDDALAHAIASNPQLEVKVRLPSGRIIDAIE